MQISDEDVGGNRGRKVVCITGTNEIAVVRTEDVRKSVWCPQLPEKARKK